MQPLSKIYYVRKLSMFRASSVPIIRSYQLYTWQLVPTAKFTADNSWWWARRCPKHGEYCDKINFGYWTHIVGYFIRNLYVNLSVWWWLVHSFIHSLFCLTTGPKPPAKRYLHIVRSRASSFKWQYPLLSLRSSSSFLRLLDTFISPFIFPSIFEEETNKMLHLEHGFVWCWNLDASGSRSEIHGKFWNVVLEEDGEDQLDRSREKWRSVT